MSIPPQRKTLRRHQRTAVNAAVHTLRNGGRCTIVAPCGTGKTVMAARICEELAETRRTRRRLVLMPTLDLLAQTVAAFQADSHHMGTVIAVCSPYEPLERLGVPQTTSATGLAALLDGLDHYTVFATYASLVDSDTAKGAVITAHTNSLITPWDLIVCDEAHRTAGHLGKAWAAVHHDDKVPATRRVYLTATPRIWTTDPKYAETLTPGEGGPYLAASMDDEDLYGPCVFSMQLSTAIAENLARDYRIVLVAINHPTLQRTLRRSRNATHKDTLALISLATATLKTCASHRIRRMITFHKAVFDAQKFIETLEETAYALDGETTHTHDDNTLVALRPGNMWARAVHQASKDRVEVMDNIRAEQPLQDGEPADLAVLANARLLGEGTDIATVDALCFASPKASVTDIVQALGRALRLHPYSTHKATLLVPIYLAPGEDPTDLHNTSAYQPLYDILLALRAHDLRIADRLPTTGLTRPHDKGEDQAQTAAGADQADTAPFGDDSESESESEISALLDTEATPAFTGLDSADEPPEIVGTDGLRLTPRDLARVMDLHVMTPPGATDGWTQSALEAMRFYDEHGHLAPTRAQGIARPTAPHRVDLYTWLSNQRTARRNGELMDWQIHLLDAHGMVWEPRVEAREALITYAEECARLTGGLVVTSGYQAADGHPVGRDLANLRVRAAAGKANPDLVVELNRIDPWWNPPWDYAWQRYYQQAAHRHLLGQSLTQPGDGRAYRQWLRNPGTDLEIDQRELLARIGLAAPDPQLNATRVQTRS